MDNAIQFSTMPSVYWDDAAKMSYLQRRIIVYSIMYYELDANCIADHEYDNLSKQLVRLQRTASQKDLQRSRYYYAMREFDGNTGYDIPHKLSKEDREYLTRVAMMVRAQAPNYDPNQN